MAANRILPRRGANRLTSARPVVPTPFRIIAQTEHDLVRICPEGELDIKTTGRIREQIETSTARGAKRVVLDLRGVTFIDSAGLHLALDVDAAARADGWQFALIGGVRRSDVDSPRTRRATRRDVRHEDCTEDATVRDPLPARRNRSAADLAVAVDGGVTRQRVRASNEHGANDGGILGAAEHSGSQSRQ